MKQFLIGAGLFFALTITQQSQAQGKSAHKKTSSNSSVYHHPNHGNDDNEDNDENDDNIRRPRTDHPGHNGDHPRVMTRPNSSTHDNGLHKGWYKGKHKGWANKNRTTRQTNRTTRQTKNRF